MLIKLRKINAISRIEFICIAGILIILTALTISVITGYKARQLKAEDNLLVNTAESVARMNTISHPCPVRDCGKGTDCEHKTKDNTYTGYFSHTPNTIVSDLPKGYNAYKTMTIGDETYHGAPGTMVIKIEVTDGEPVLSWVKGR